MAATNGIPAALPRPAHFGTDAVHVGQVRARGRARAGEGGGRGGEGRGRWGEEAKRKRAASKKMRARAARACRARGANDGPRAASRLWQHCRRMPVRCQRAAEADRHGRGRARHPCNRSRVRRSPTRSRAPSSRPSRSRRRLSRMHRASSRAASTTRAPATRRALRLKRPWPRWSRASTVRSRRPFVRLRTHACSLAAGRARGCAPPEGVAPGFAFASGSAATATLINMFAAGDHILSVSDVYGGTNRYFNRVAVPIGFEVTMVDMSNLDNVKKAFKANTKVGSAQPGPAPAAQTRRSRTCSFAGGGARAGPRQDHRPSGSACG